MLERMVISGDDLPKFLHSLAGAPDVSEAVVLATCNRTEVYLVAERFHPAYAQIRDFFSDLTFLAPDAFSDSLYTHYDEHALRHLFEVSAGLDSAVTGEHEILGQVKKAWEIAQDEGTARRSMNMVFRHALEVGKRARSETSIAHHVTSVSQAAVILAGTHMGTGGPSATGSGVGRRSAHTTDAGLGRIDGEVEDCDLDPCIGAGAARGLAGRRAVVIGAGSMAKGMASFLAAADVADLVIVNRTLRRAESLAETISVQNGAVPIRAAGLEDLREVVGKADVVLSAATVEEHLITRELITERDAASRVGGQLLIVDVGLPRNVDPQLTALEGVDVLDMDDISRLTDAGMAVRRAQVEAVGGIVDEELRRFEDLMRARSVAPVITSLRSTVESMRVAELERLSRKTSDLSDEQLDLVDRITRGVVAKLLHEPSVRLRETAGTGRGDRLAEAVRDLFDLDVD